MKAIVLGILIAGGIALASSFILAENQRPAFDRFATSSVRVGVPGDNLVGPEWATPEGEEATENGSES